MEFHERIVTNAWITHCVEYVLVEAIIVPFQIFVFVTLSALPLLLLYLLPPCLCCFAVASNHP